MRHQTHIFQRARNAFTRPSPSRSPEASPAMRAMRCEGMRMIFACGPERAGAVCAAEKPVGDGDKGGYAEGPELLPTGSGHNRGIAVDLTIINLSTKKEFDMGTGFDNFSDTAHHAFTQLPSAVLQNRQLLKKIMEDHGFKALDTEWWHYYLPNSRQYELLDIPFARLKKMK